MTRVGFFFFGKNPQQYERAFKIKAVAFAGNSIGGKEYIDSRDILGTVPMMFRDGMSFLKSMLHHNQNGQNFNSVGQLDIPEVVLEELVQNALVHIDLLHAAAIRLLVYDNRIEIINPGRLYGGLKVEDIMLGASKQRNPLMASFAERTMIYRGLGSGIVRAMNENVFLDFINEEEANQFRVIIWRTTQKDVISAQKAEFTAQKEISTTQKAVLEFFRNHPKGTRAEAALAITDLTEDGVKYTIGRLQQLGLLKREGGRKDGHWVVKDTHN